jgi:hypothetical protein
MSAFTSGRANLVAVCLSSLLAAESSAELSELYRYLDSGATTSVIQPMRKLKMMSTPAVHMRELCLRFELLYL